MKKFVVVFIAIAMSFSVKSQEVIKQKEVGVSFRDLNNFGLVFKTGNTESLWRFGAMSTSGNIQKSEQDSTEVTQNSFGLRLAAGKEFRKPLTEDLSLVIGMDASCSISTSKTDDEDFSVDNLDYHAKYKNYGAALNIILGVNYQINEKFSLQGEILPSVSYQMSHVERTFYTGIVEESDATGFYYQLSNSSATLSLVYCF